MYMSRKFLIIGIIVLSSLIGALLVYNFILKKQMPDKKSEPAVSEKIFEPELKAISQEPVVSVALDSAGRAIRYYLRRNGKVIESDFEGQNQKIVSETVLSDLQNVLWSPQKNKIISIYKNGDKYFYDYDAKKSIRLHPNIKSVVWSKDNDKIAYQFIDAKRNSLNISNPDGSDWRPLTFYTENRILRLDWVSNKIYFYPTPSGYISASLSVLDIDKRTSKNIISGANGLIVNWAPTGDKFIFSKTDFQGKRLSLFISDKDGSSVKDFGFSVLAEKCVWSGDSINIFCASPKLAPAFAVMPDDYYKGTFINADYFIKINTNTFEKTWLINPNLIRDYDASNLFLSPNEDYLFFINRADGLLYSLKLAG